MSKTHYINCYTIAFECASLREKDSTARAILAALKARVQEMEEDLAEPDSYPGYAGDARPEGTRRALIHEACDPPFDWYETDAEHIRKWKTARHMPVGES